MWAASIPEQVTFQKEVLPIMPRNYQNCPRAGEAARLYLLSCKGRRSFARAMKEAVVSRQMPPWPADPHFGKFANDGSMPQADIATLVVWSDMGAQEGNAKDAPKAVTFLAGWNIGKPDVVLETAKPMTIPAKGTIESTYSVIPVGNKKDVWVEQAEVRLGSRWLKAAKPGEECIPPVVLDAQDRERKENTFGGQWLTGNSPGMPPWLLEPGKARLVPAGSGINLQIHNPANGKEPTDASRVGLVFAKQSTKELVLTLAGQNSRFEIPSHAETFEVKGEVTLHEL